jgi:DedD protein
MNERIADNADLAVDELKRRARRRLVGAIVLALAAAVILPMLLEKEPKPLGDDVSVQIPPIDEGRFINRLTGRAAESKNASKSDPKAAPKAAAPNAVPKTDVAAPIAAPKTDVTAPVAAASSTPDAQREPAPASTNVSPPKKSVAEAEQRMLSPGNKPPAKAETKPAEAPKEAPPQVAKAALPASPVPEPAAPSQAEGFAVQIAAFTDDKGANALAGKLKKAGYAAAYTEPVETSRGTLWRVRVGGFSTRADAETARAKLKAEGWNGLVVASK